MNEFFGRNGFIWWSGVCEDRQDPLKLGRYKIRMFGWHTEDKQKLPTEFLPWCHPSLPLDNGRNVVGMKEGDWCWGFFRDGEKAQEPIVVGYVPGIPEDSANPEIGFYDPTPEESLTPGALPRPPEYTPKIESEDGEESTESTSSIYKNPDVLPGDNIAFGELVKDYDPKNYKWDINGDGSYNAADADAIINSSGSSDGEETFDGELDFEDITYPMSRYPLNERLNEPDSSRLARNEKIEQTIVAKKKGFVSSGDTASHAGIGIGSDKAHESEPFIEPKTPYAAMYPYNHVYESESGHIKEIDDTPGAERLHDYHRSGTFVEVHPDGTRVVKGVADGFNIFIGDYFMYSEMTASLSAKKDILIKSGEFMNIQSGSDMNIISGGNRTDKIGGDHNIKVEGSEYKLVGADSRIIVKGNATLLVEGNLSTKVEGNYVLDVAGATRISSQGPMEINSSATLGIKSPFVSVESGLTSVIGPAAGHQMIVASAGTAASVDVIPPIPPEVPVVPVEEENEAEESETEIQTTSSPKEGFILYGTAGDLYKPFSDSTGNAVSLSPTLGAGIHSFYEALPTGELETVKIEYKHVDGSITSWDVVRPVHKKGSLIERGQFAGIGNGNREHYRFSKPGSEYPTQFFLVIGETDYLILDGGVRHESFGGA